MAIAWIDISTGEFSVSQTSQSALNSDLARLVPKEILLADQLFIDSAISPILREHRQALTPHASNVFEYNRTENRLKTFFNIAETAGLGNFSKAEIASCGALIEYIELTQKGTLPHLAFPKQFKVSNFMAIDQATRKSLEISQTSSGSKKGSLLNSIDKTITGGGARLLANYISAPLTNPEAINMRLDIVNFFINSENVRFNLCEILKRVPDMERALSRICMDKASPRDLAAIRNGLAESMLISETLEFSGEILPDGITSYLKGIDSHDEILSKLKEALQDEIGGGLARDGGYIKHGYHNKLDELRELRDNSQNKIIELKERYKAQTGINTLKITHNNVLGFFVEVTPMHSSKIPQDGFIHRQTLANAVRYTSVELRQLESDILNAREHALRLELMLFEELVQDIKKTANSIYLTAQSIAGIDVMLSFANLAISHNYTRPQIDNSLTFKIEGGRHAVVERELQEKFIKNDVCLIGNQRLWLLTGPNMAGKSTFLRQNALIAIMAHIGCFVPADAVHIGIIDKIFSRVGASDDLARGRSTFMVEILNNATQRSLVILDEIGRGTATYDGLSIAWAVVEYLHNTNRCRALFATHYHELTSLKQQLPSLACYTMKVKEWQNKVIFMHEVVKGAADRSYGIHVAELAGLPVSVTKRARKVLEVLSQSDTQNATNKLTVDLPLFTQEQIIEPVIEETSNTNPIAEEIFQQIQNINVDNLSPKQALEVLYKLKGMV